ncbi:Mth938-like domain-containing protein [Roseibacterium sp. SDUM158016]|uniref:Mth938-like domain-containing protein n=1 Tax=Roseicyclus sediminis TaxID=2980997 RepID=UPI0021D29CFA|nr:Mth938-like domain-containing protein [Roseibacterium sp. SDUM158016]MCU4654874.1 Mth938-like domain-containing protein [Roseibacterium sp. SDUM158016]
MRITEVDFGTGTPIDGYGTGFFRVGGKVVNGGALILPGSVAAWDGYDATAPILAAADAIDILILGTGGEIAHPPQAFRKALEAAGIGVEPMASPAACRTYNVLLSEGRRVGAAVLPLG